MILRRSIQKRPRCFSSGSITGRAQSRGRKREASNGLAQIEGTEESAVTSSIVIVVISTKKNTTKQQSHIQFQCLKVRQLQVGGGNTARSSKMRIKMDLTPPAKAHGVFDVIFWCFLWGSTPSARCVRQFPFNVMFMVRGGCNFAHFSTIFCQFCQLWNFF